MSNRLQNRLIVAGVVAAGALLAGTTAGSAGAASGDDGAVIQRVPVYGGGYALFGGCVDTFEIPVGADCVETELIFAKEIHAFAGDGSAGPQAATWYAYFQTYRITRPTDAEPEFTEYRDGYTEDVLVDVDTQHLGSANLTATARMSDGSTQHFQGRWEPWSDVQRYGRDGPALDFPGHLVNDCYTLVGNAHQKFRFATMSGTMNGQPVRSYTWAPFNATIFNNRFVFVTAPHGPRCP